MSSTTFDAIKIGIASPDMIREKQQMVDSQMVLVVVMKQLLIV